MLSIHQSQYLPWPAFFKKIALSEIFVILDDVQFQKNGVQNRNKLRNKNGDFWLTIPVIGSHGETILEKKIADTNWRRKHFLSISQSYSRSPNWNIFQDDIRNILNIKTNLLHEVNTNFIQYFLNYFNLKTEIIFSSSMGIKSSKGDLIIDICKEVGAERYISGLGAKDYINLDDFKSNNIEVCFLPSRNPIYNQYSGEFIPDLSIIDLVMNESKDFVLEYLYGESNFADK